MKIITPLPSHHQRILNQANSTGSLHLGQIQLSFNYISASAFVLCLAILSGETYCDNPSWTIGIKKKKKDLNEICLQSYLPQFAFLTILIYWHLCLWLKIRTIYNYASWMDGQNMSWGKLCTVLRMSHTSQHEACIKTVCI